MIIIVLPRVEGQPERRAAAEGAALQDHLRRQHLPDSGVSP